MGYSMMQLRRGIMLNTPHLETADLAVVGKNICPPIYDGWVKGYVNSYNGGIDAQNNVRLEMSSGFIPITPNTNYVFSYGMSGQPSDSLWCGVGIYNSNKGFIRRPTSSATSLAFTSDSTAAFVRVSFRTYGIGINPQLETGTTASAYVPYQKTIGARFRTDMKCPMKKLTAEIAPSQDLHGHAGPWPPGAGVNMFNIDDPGGWAFVPSGATITTSGYVISMKIIGSGGTRYYHAQEFPGGITVTFSGKSSKRQPRVYIRCRKADDSDWITNSDASISGFNYNSYYSGWYADLGEGLAFTKTAVIPSCLYWQVGVGYNNVGVTTGDIETISEFQIELGSSASIPYAPYANICSISGWTGANIIASPTVDAQDGTTYSISWQSSEGVIYGGTLDILAGVLTIDKIKLVFNGASGGNRVTYKYPNRYVFNMSAGEIGNAGLAKTANANSKIGAISDTLQNVTDNEAYASVEGFSTSTSGGFAKLAMPSVAAADVATMNTWLSNNPVTIVAPIETPRIVQLSRAEIRAIIGQNYIWTDAGPITDAVYWTHIEEVTS